MRLINTATLELQEFTSDDPPKYAILSHTWGNEEVSYADFYKPEKKSCEGYKKIQASCQLALELGHPYIWIDTCCIDKSSSAELSEAINSMFNWYARAEKCIAYLADVASAPDSAGFEDELRQSRWFTRGWTLQEMLAPKRVTFYGQQWNPLGTKDHLSELVWSITRIRKDCLIRGGDAAKLASVAQIMFWASSRQTTRGEDRAYSLMGLLDVNMPLLYGEGADKAFLRLQLEVIRDSSDESIFAWSNPEPRLTSTLMFARSPDDFRDSKDVITTSVSPSFDRAPYRYTNKGLEFEILDLRSHISSTALQKAFGPEITARPQEQMYVVPLNCCRLDAGDSVICITLLVLNYFVQYWRLKYVTRTSITQFPSLEVDAFRHSKDDWHTVFVLGRDQLGRLGIAVNRLEERYVQ